MNTVVAAGGAGTLAANLGAAAIIIGYWVPTIIAWIRRVPNKGSVTVINVFLGWTVIGWIVALAMAVRSRPQPAAPVTR